VIFVVFVVICSNLADKVSVSLHVMESYKATVVISIHVWTR